MLPLPPTSSSLHLLPDHIINVISMDQASIFILIAITIRGLYSSFNWYKPGLEKLFLGLFKKKIQFLGLFYKKKKLESDKLGLVTDPKGQQPLIFASNNHLFNHIKSLFWYVLSAFYGKKNFLRNPSVKLCF